MIVSRAISTISSATIKHFYKNTDFRLHCITSVILLFYYIVFLTFGHKILVSLIHKIKATKLTDIIKKEYVNFLENLGWIYF